MMVKKVVLFNIYFFDVIPYKDRFGIFPILSLQKRAPDALRWFLFRSPEKY